MDHQTWETVKSILGEALELPPEQRNAYLNETCKGRPALKAEVLSLLKAEDDAATFLESPIGPASNGDEVADLFEPERIGPYRIVATLGCGGMGTVYKAVREGDFVQEVAIKVIRPWSLTQDTVQRFQKERQILANLNHPNIAKLYEGGTTEQGQPYFVMEYIPGQAIDKYCDNHKLDIRSRLLLFSKVCEAVKFAHQNLIVHRDIKPHNVLVTPDGTPKLLDFGIAKTLNPEKALTLTASEFRMMTPEFASPEQIRGEAITTASDVYSLGVLLYELLTGHRPYQIKQALLSEIERVICQEIPAKPSEVVRQTTERKAPDGTLTLVDPQTVSTTRGGDTRKLIHQLQGDVDNIVMMALRKEPGRRYSSVEGFLGDIQRFLGGYPIQARQESWTYRSAKFLARNRLAVGAAGFVFLLILGFALTVTVLLRQTAQERDMVRKQRDKYQTIADFSAEIFKVADPFDTGNNRLSARELLDRARFRIDQDLNSQPLVKATMLEAMGVAYGGLGHLTPARTMLAQAVELRKVHPQESPAERAATMVAYAHLLVEAGALQEAEQQLDEAQDLCRQQDLEDGAIFLSLLLARATLARARADYEQAAHFLDQAGAMQKDQPGNHPKLWARTLGLAAELKEAQGKHLEVEPLYQEAIAATRSLFGDAHPRVAGLYNDLGEFYFRTGNLERASALFHQALSMKEAQLDAGHPSLAETQSNLAGVMENQGQPEEAEQRYLNALAIYASSYGPSHTLYARTLNNLGRICAKSARYKDALEYYRLAREITALRLGENHPFYANVLNNLAGAFRRMGMPAEARKHYAQALEIEKEKLGANHPELVATLSNMADLANEEKDYALAVVYQQQAVNLLEQAYGPDGGPLIPALAGLARFLVKTNEANQAAEVIQHALELQAQQGGTESSSFLYATILQAEIMAALGQEQRAADFYHRADRIWEKLEPPEPYYGILLAESKARFARDFHHHERAEAWFRQGLEAAKAYFGQDHYQTAISLQNMARFLADIQHFKQAEPLYREALAIKEKSKGEHPATALTLHNLAECMRDLGDVRDAVTHYSRALAIRTKAYGADHPKTLETESALNRLLKEKAKTQRP